ncbi:dihydrodipicolinate reductase [Natranaerovirga hydrolytica]|uniref:4-hydroxy-tetrahydrodipicolinate reductase n=1 Tax=Natranaerovirga hydrolytica TaxID=680378 RepID=A0A4R1MFV2_9FIRM|nr:4-hydroxy-tetrahydrodipicolinate reductase [Natranaerovirga hydrolytica]TCK90620.1 dihydrodipicolinate reductase [Natranaerovirga hydrolytica]
MIKIIMHGCNGKMGQVISDLVKADKEAEIVAGIDSKDSIDNGYPVFTDITKCDVKADVIIDFSIAKAVDALIDFAIEKSMPLVLCTTGLSEAQIKKVEDASGIIPVLRSSNMSLGVNALVSIAKAATEILAKSNYDIEIIEKHHNQKVDAPSGTAIMFAEAINEVLNNTYSYNYDRHESNDPRPKEEIGMHTIRGGTIVGEHSILFAGQDEVIELKHTAQSKAIFANGSIKAAKYLTKKSSGLYDMNNVIFG